jgi:hypothetical protein
MKSLAVVWGVGGVEVGVGVGLMRIVVCRWGEVTNVLVVVACKIEEEIEVTRAVMTYTAASAV